MSGLVESAQRCQQLVDQHSERYLNTAVGKFPAEVVRASLDKLKKQGFEVRLKTEQETNADLEAFDLAHRVQARPVLRTSYTDQRRRELLEEVNALLISGHALPAACKIAKVKHGNYLKWRRRYGGQLPALQPVGKKRGEGDERV